MKTAMPILLPVAGALLMLFSGIAPGNGSISLDEAVSSARERYPGRVLSAETRRENGRERHSIRILTDDGQVRRLQIDAQSGNRMPRSQRR
jgi:uncharacterized membrane protein YkoI